MKPYKTETFYVAVWLLSRGFVPTLEWDGNICTFKFKDLPVDEALKHVQEYHQDQVIQEFIQANRALKDMMYSREKPSGINE